MERVLCLEQYSTLVKTARKEHPVNQTNCYLFSDAVNKYIETNKLFFEIINGGVVFLVEEAAFFQLYYLVGAIEAIQMDRKSKPVVLDIIYEEGKTGTGFLLEIERKWLDCGFINYKRYRHLVLRMMQELLDSIPSSLEDNDYEMFHANAGDSESILRLWESSLDPYSTVLPSADEMKDIIEREIVLCAREKVSGKLSAVMKLGTQRNTFIVHHVVVDKEHRKKGLGKRLFDYCYRDTGKPGMQYYSWVDVHNTPSMQLHLSKGWTFNGRITSQLLLDC